MGEPKRFFRKSVWGQRVTLLRAVFAALAITTMAGWVGPHLAGLFPAFPITMLPLLVMVQFTYQTDPVRTILPG